MASPYPLTARPGTATLDWVREVTGGGKVVSVRHLAGGSSHANHVITIDTEKAGLRRVVLRRWARPGWEVLDPDFGVQREVDALLALSSRGISSPNLLAADPDATHTDVPALVMSLLPGRRPSPARVGKRITLAAMAEAIHQVHALPFLVPPVPKYRPWNASIRRPPPNSTRPALWEQGFDILTRPTPRDAPCLIHRDFHPGNTLFVGAALTGIVDWTTTSWGSPSIDLAHMRHNLAHTHGLEAVQGFLSSYQNHAGGYTHDPYWDVRTVIDLLSDDPRWAVIPGPVLNDIELHLATAVAQA